MKSFLQVCCVTIMLFSCGSEKQSTNTGSRSIVQPEASELREFDYQPPKPVNGQLYAAIELGAIGLNYFVIEIDKEQRWALKKSSFARSNIIYGINTTKEILKNIGEFRNEILDFGVASENIHIIASSSAIKADIIGMLKSELSKQNLQLKYIESAAEGRYALAATIPKEFISESFLVDIGSGNTKLSWIENNDTLSIDIHGSKYFLGDVQDTTVFREVRDAILEIPESNRYLCFMLGGMIYEFEKDQIDQNENRYFVLKSPNEYPADNEKLRAANVIYNALYLKPTYSYIFDSKSNFSIGYLIDLKK